MATTSTGFRKCSAYGTSCTFSRYVGAQGQLQGPAAAGLLWHGLLPWVRQWKRKFPPGAARTEFHNPHKTMQRDHALKATLTSDLLPFAARVGVPDLSHPIWSRNTRHGDEYSFQGRPKAHGGPMRQGQVAPAPQPSCRRSGFHARCDGFAQLVHRGTAILGPRGF